MMSIGGSRVRREVRDLVPAAIASLTPTPPVLGATAGTTVPLAAFTPDRLAMFPDTPTFKELGQDFVYFMQRSVVGAPGMSDEAAAYYQDLFKKVFDSPEWAEYRTKKSLQGDFLAGAALMDYWMNEREIHRQMLVKMGAIEG